MDLATGLTMLTKGAHQMPNYMYKFGMSGKVIMLTFAIFWIIMLLNCLQRNFKVNTDKIAWILVLVFLPGIGALIYLFAILFMFKKKK